jgi:hypothetical protein
VARTGGRITRIKGVRVKSVRIGNLFSVQQAQALPNAFPATCRLFVPNPVAATPTVRRYGQVDDYRLPADPRASRGVKASSHTFRLKLALFP